MDNGDIEQYLTFNFDGSYQLNHPIPQSLLNLHTELPKHIDRQLPTLDYETAINLASAIIFETELLISCAY